MQKYYQIIICLIIALYNAAIMAITACTQYCIVWYWDRPLMIKEQIIILQPAVTLALTVSLQQKVVIKFTNVYNYFSK